MCSLIKIEKVALAAYAASPGPFRVLRECIGLLSTPRAASFRNDFDIKRFLVFVVASLPLISGAYSVGQWERWAVGVSVCCIAMLYIFTIL